MPSSRRRSTSSDKPATRATSRTRSDVYSGKSAREESERVVAESKKRQEEAGKMPFRFYMNQNDEKSFIILDEEPKFLRWEHEEWDSRNKKMKYHGCISATDNCPACDSLEYRSYFAMYLTIIDLTPFTTKKGDDVEFSKKLLVVKQNQHKLFWRKFDKSGSLRGMLFDSFRDKKTDARIGGTIELAETLTEDELQDYVREYEDRDGKPQTEDVEPYDYLDLFPEVTLEDLEKTFGTAPAAGSSRQAAKELEDNFEEDNDEGDPIRDPEEGKGRVVRRGAATRSGRTSNTRENSSNEPKTEREARNTRRRR